MQQYIVLADIALELESAMRRLGLWRREEPVPQDLESGLPFCVDTLAFDQWLQFVFLRRLKNIIEQQLPLPGSSDIKPMAEEYFKQDAGKYQAVVRPLEKFDHLVNNS